MCLPLSHVAATAESIPAEAHHMQQSAGMCCLLLSAGRTAGAAVQPVVLGQMRVGRKCVGSARHIELGLPCWKQPHPTAAASAAAGRIAVLVFGHIAAAVAVAAVAVAAAAAAAAAAPAAARIPVVAVALVLPPRFPTGSSGN